LAAIAAKANMPAVALTDLDGLYAAVGFQKACDQVGVKPIFGVELRLTDGSGVVLLAASVVGYGNLCRLVSTRHLRSEQLSITDVAEHAKGVVCLLDDGWHADSALSVIRDAFGRNLYVALSIHSSGDAPAARRRAAWADAQGLRIVATCASRCLHRNQSYTLRALSSIGTLTLLDDPHPDKPVGAWHFRSVDEMEHLFKRRPDALHNTVEIAEQCAFSFDLTQIRFPAFESTDKRSAMQHLRALCVAGCHRRYIEQPQQKGIGGKRPTLAEALERIERELSIIEQVRYAEYFLVFHEIVEHCRQQGIATLARGSAADSLICYVLGVSHACPFRFDLPFDRFVNPERAKFSKMADIDLDLPWDRRDEVIGWVYDRWGHDRVAMIGSANTYRARAAVAELGKVFGLPAHEIHQTTKRIPHMTSRNLSRAIAMSPEARGIPVDQEPYQTVLKMACELTGLPHHWSMHPCGLVVSPHPLADLVPVQRSAKGPLVAQYEMDAIEDLGFIKIDLLGQAGLSVLRDAVDEIERTEGHRVDLDCDVDYSEAKTWAMIASGEARGVHHIESPAMTNLIRQCDCRDIDCLTAVVAVIRPGAANQGKKNAFARRYQGREPPQYAHPSLESVLKQTFGVMVFEEHILQVAVEFANMNLGRADVLRRALNKENRDLIMELKEEFYACALQNKRTQQEIDCVWPVLQNFCGFMFNKAHSAEYAVEAFQGAWLKRRWPIHYLAAVLSNYRGFYAHSPTLPQILYVMEAMRCGATFRPPCVNRSRPRFAVEGEDRRCVRLPVSHIKDLSADFIARHSDERKHGAFATPEEFVHRCRPGYAELQRLLDSGALDVFGTSRPTLFWRLRRMVKRTGTDDHQASFWQSSTGDEADDLPVELTAPDRHRIAQREMDLLGFPITIDPLTFLGSDDTGSDSSSRGEIEWPQYIPVEEMRHHVGRRVSVCGLMVADRINRTTTGDLMKFITLADKTGFAECFVFPKVYQRFGHLTLSNPILAATGVVEAFENDNGVALRVLSIATPKRIARCR
ncbi:MAG: DNA polymerase III subunit alpha, partial [Planctomycetes bacterium]|nr:DNA polymerase III subunit alpha [Planctomycetota bacterium]